MFSQLISYVCLQHPPLGIKLLLFTLPPTPPSLAVFSPTSHPPLLLASSEIREFILSPSLSFIASLYQLARLVASMDRAILLELVLLSMCLIELFSPLRGSCSAIIELFWW